MAKPRTLGVVAVLGAALATPAPAATFRLVTGNGYAPFTGEGLHGGGVATRLVREAFAAAGHRADIAFRPWQRGYAATRRGRFAATFPYVRSPRRNDEMRFSAPMFTVETLAISRSGDPVRYTGDVQPLTAHRMCEPRGYERTGTLGDLLAADKIPVTAQPASMQACARAVRHGRADYFVANNFRWPSLLAGTGLAAEAFHVAAEPLHQAPHYLIAGKGNERGRRALAVFNRGLAALKEAGRWRDLLGEAKS